MNKQYIFFLILAIFSLRSQQTPIYANELLTDIYQLILKQLTDVDAPTETEALYVSAENIRNFFTTNKRWQKLNTIEFTGELIKELAWRYTGGNVIDAAHALGTYTAGQWLVKYLAEQEKKMPSTQLMMAIEPGYKNLVDYLIKRGANVNEKNKQGETALMIAARNCNEAEILQLLIDSGAQINATDNLQNTALFWAVINHCVENINVLLKAGAHVDIKNKDGQTPLSIAATDGNVAIVNVLLEAHPDLDLKMIGGYTPLMNAVEEGHVNIIQLLLQYGALTTIKNDNGQTALDIAYDAEGPKRNEIIKLLNEAQEKQSLLKPKRKRKK